MNIEVDGKKYKFKINELEEIKLCFNWKEHKYNYITSLEINKIMNDFYYYYQDSEDNEKVYEYFFKSTKKVLKKYKNDLPEDYKLMGKNDIIFIEIKDDNDLEFVEYKGIKPPSDTKQMIYREKETIKILQKGEYKEFKYCIVSYGTHPCCYVFLPKGHKYDGKHYDKIDIDCHGGLTFADRDLFFNPIQTNDWIIGWDYNHCDDYAGYYNDIDNVKYKKWSTYELYDEIKKVIEQL